MPEIEPRGHVITEYTEYFSILKAYNSAPGWQKDMLLRGTLLQMCSTMKPEAARPRLQRFWTQQAHLRGLDMQQLQT